MKPTIEVFVDAMRYSRGFSPGSCSAYRTVLCALADFLSARGRTAWAEVSAADLRDYLADLDRREYAATTRRRNTAILRTFFDWLLDEELISKLPTENIRVGAQPRRLPNTLGERTLQELIEAVDGTDYPDVRDRAILELLYDCGLRCTELTTLQLHHLDLTRRLLRVHGKGRKERVVPFGEAADWALKAYLAARTPFAESLRKGALAAALRKPTAPLFLAPRGGMLSRSAVARIVHRRIHAFLPPGMQATPHTLRHAFATHLLEHGAPLLDIRDLLGHASIATTQIYTHVDQAHLRSTFDRCFPRT
ncbi:MAG: tyrosine-type recombinase/integrase [Candidatus Spyradenecus sp.]